MQYAEHECIVFLSGNLTTMPIITADWTKNAIISVTRKYFTSKKKIESESYTVTINQYDTARIIQSGFLEMPIEIHGELRAKDKTDIIATHVEFVKYPTSNQTGSIAYRSAYLSS
ncbi:MAG: hypothetical protein A3F13_00905 [Gammaproteobacteria bacterium RIFCSPHIGHO2_12_FULL_40_19]|nr:MAG: hypothetical protein A3F13_00905 [Gammaproteobacteria bacterium RIFCSPHIGHO2_12_FULL_40_19]